MKLQVQTGKIDIICFVYCFPYRIYFFYCIIFLDKKIYNYIFVCVESSSRRYKNVYTCSQRMTRRIVMLADQLLRCAYIGCG